ncbi:MAG TPA: MFS transporter [Acidimicrobiales bacterium]|nr:MFS transporter [Acidimicrobiales bacterium]
MGPRAQAGPPRRRAGRDRPIGARSRRDGAADLSRTSLGSDYRRLWVASTVSNAGDGVFLVALPLLAASLTRSPGRVSAVALAGRLPWLLFALVSGALVDRWDRRRVMWVVDAGRGVVVALLAAAVLAGQTTIPMLMVAAFLLGSGETLFDNASQSFLSSVVGREAGRLQRANSQLMGGEIVAEQFAGPPAGGLLYAVGRAVPFAADAASFVVSAALVAGVRTPPPARPPAAPARRLMGEIGEGMRWLWGHRLLRTLALLVGATSLVFTAGEAVLVLFAQEKLGVGPVGFGLLGVGAAAGGLLGTVVGTRLERRLGAGPVLLGSIASLGVVQLAVGLASQAWLVCALFGVTGTATVAWNVITVSLRQAVVPEHLLGRVNSVYRLLAWGPMTIGAAMGGLLAGRFGLRAPYLVGGVALLVAPLLAARVVSTDAVAAARAAAGTEA